METLLKVKYFHVSALAKKNMKNMILVPIAFVNEHIETLHELDIEYGKELAEKVVIIIAY